MEKSFFLTLMFLISFVMSSCFTSSTSKRKIASLTSGQDDNSSIGKGARKGDGDIDGDDENESTTTVEIRHLVDPFDGAYKTKLTIPRNFTGLMYISGLNVASLADRLVKVRFRFGKDLDGVVEIPATVGIGPGITGTSNISVLILDIQDQPFKDIRLLYDLFDYNNYATGDEPIVDNRNNRLYCRGLTLDYDPTFEGTSSSCSSSGDKCLYAYAKIRDAGLYDTSGSVNVNSRPTEPAIDLTGNGYNSDTAENMLNKCLPDSGTVAYSNSGGTLSLDTTSGTSATPSSTGVDVLTVNGQNYKYFGPYYAIDTSNWEITTTASIHDHIAETDTSKQTPRGLFMKEGTTGDINTAYYSYMFPRAGQMTLRAGVQYLGANGTGGSSTLLASYNITADRVLASLLSNGDTDYMDGCSIRASNYNSQSYEHLGSCSVTATMEIYTEDSSGKETIITSNNDIKLQLVPPSLTDSVGQEVLYTAMKSCSTSNACANDECCFNNRCVSKDIVSQCKEDTQDSGNQGIGESCSNDFQCTSLCCNSATGTCAVHDNIFDPPVLCSKSPGDKCVAKEWCREDIVQRCLIVKTGLDQTGQQTCALRCYNEKQHGDCINGRCFAPSTPAVPTFDSANPDCTNAVDPPTIEEDD